MMRRTGWALVSAIVLTGIGCAHTPQPDVIHAQLAAPVDKVKIAVTEVLTDSGYEDIVWKNETTLETSYREESGGWDGLYRCCWGVIKSRVEATVTPGADQTTQLQLHVFAEGKRTLWEGYIPVKTPRPESPENQLRLIKNKLKIVSHPYTTQTFFKLQ